MTDLQISEILFHPRDEDGKLDFSATDGEAMSWPEFMFWQWRLLKPDATDDELREKFKKEYPSYGG